MVRNPEKAHAMALAVDEAAEENIAWENVIAGYPEGSQEEFKKSYKEYWGSSLVNDVIAKDTDKANCKYNSYADEAAEDYEVSSLARRLGKTEKEVRQRMDEDLKATVECGSAIIANREKFGEKISVATKA
ncbi:MAG: hypothetical protein ACREGF_03985, partial [Candidatus Saccharimonadales bacterium]